MALKHQQQQRTPEGTYLIYGFLARVPVEYKLDTFNIPRTGTTLCHPKIGYVNAMLLFCSRHLAINSPLGNFNGDNADSPSQKYQTHETRSDILSSKNEKKTHQKRWTIRTLLFLFQCLLSLGLTHVFCCIILLELYC